MRETEIDHDTRKAWDFQSKRFVAPGTRRWEVNYYVWESVKKSKSPDRDPLVDTACIREVFSSEESALRWAHSVIAGDNPLICWYPCVQEQVFEPSSEGSCWWEPLGEWVEVDDDSGTSTCA